jgi:protein-S-isoprenylcysteine O-methyltransferase Ste14
METGAGGLILLGSAAFVYLALEIWIALRDGWLGLKTSFRDPSVRLINNTVMLTWILAIGAALALPDLTMTSLAWPLLIAGVLMIYAAAGIRFWCVRTLGRFFRRVVELQTEHRTVTEGPYRYARHPAYAAFLLAEVGLGVALANPVSLAVCLVLPPVGVLSRIPHEEAALEGELGDEYRAYARRTKRLIPGVW